jgi:TPR repeat protein/serine/threonine protein kinase
LDSRLLLPVNTLLDGAYRIVCVLGTGGFGITYEAEDVALRTKVALKEYYPFDFGDRDASMSVKPKSERHKPTFDWGRSSFVQEARMLARFDHPSIVRVSRVFEANSTAYMVMRLEQGQSFEAWLKGLGRPPTQTEIDRITGPLLDALETMHAQNFLHRDIAPDNIIVRADGTPVLLDFGAARRAVGEMSRTLTGVVKAGYSPQEQYATDSRMQGPWTDFYALGGVLYRAVTGRPPEEATLRAIDDGMPPAARAAKTGYRPAFLEAIDACLAVRHADRPQSAAALRPMLLGQGPPATAEPQRFTSTGRNASSTSAEPAPWMTAKRWLLIAASLALVAGGYGGLEFTRWSGEQQHQLDADAKRRQNDQAAAAKRTADERARQEQEARRLSDTAAAKKKTDEDALAKTLTEADAKRRQNEKLAAERQARAQQEAEASRKAQEERIAAETRAISEKTQQSAQAARDWQDGERYLHGRGVTKDYAKARELFEKAAAGGNSGGTSGLGWLHENGLGLPKDHAMARDLYEKAVAAGNSAAMNNLARLYRNGWGGPRDYVKSRELSEKAAASGNNLGMLNVGWLYQNGWGAPRDFAKAREWYERAAATGNTAAMANIGWLYYEGLGVTRDYVKAREWFEKAAAAGGSAGTQGLGVLYERGQGVAQDHAKARELFEKAAATGNDNAMNSLGWLLQSGPVGSQDYAKAREWYEKAIVTSNKFALRNLAMLLDEGLGGPADAPRAARLLLEAARVHNNAAIDDLRGSMAKWSDNARIEVKRELTRLGHYQGPLNGTWDNNARNAIGAYLAAGT